VIQVIYFIDPSFTEQADASRDSTDIEKKLAGF
jgi:hypothetical protein